MGQLRQWVGLVHELGKLRAAEELPHRGDHRTDVNQPLGSGGLGVHQSHFFFDHPLHPEQANADLILDQFANRSDAAVAQVVDVVRAALALVDADYGADDRDHVFQTQSHQVVIRCLSEAAVQLVASNPAQVIAAWTEEQVSDQGSGVLEAGRFTGP